MTMYDAVHFGDSYGNSLCVVHCDTRPDDNSMALCFLSGWIQGHFPIVKCLDLRISTQGRFQSFMFNVMKMALTHQQLPAALIAHERASIWTTPWRRPNIVAQFCNLPDCQLLCGVTFDL